MVNDARQYCNLKGSFELKYGGVLNSAEIAFETWGNLNTSKDNGVLIFTGLSPSAHAASSDADPSPGWWENIVGPKKPIDTDQYFVICANSLGSCFGSTGPASINPKTQEPYRLEFP
ncbi:TPA: homoserine O-acetyltransferase, partial [Candidatus Poribacteria bacterium]|nr:homoserine O-acetyltransferase [Candidatus Poribacteria bacterium]